MKKDQVSKTAFRLALFVTMLHESEDWRNQLPEGSGELANRLLLSVNGSDLGLLPKLRRASTVAFYKLYERTVNRGFLDGVGTRKVFMNEQALTALEEGAGQILVLGAGFDTLCLRLAPQYPQVKFFEIDHPATSALKLKAVTQEGLPENMFLIPADLARTPLSKVLSEYVTWDPSVRSFITAEGLLMYLTQEQVHELFHEAATCTGQGSTLALSHLTSQTEYRLVRLMMRLSGEGWYSSSTSEGLPHYVGPYWKPILTKDRVKGKGMEGFAVIERDNDPIIASCQSHLRADDRANTPSF